VTGDRTDQLAAVGLVAIGVAMLPWYLWRERQVHGQKAWRAVIGGREVYVLSGGHGFDTTVRYGSSTNGWAR